MWGFIINGIQSSALEWKEMTEVPWDGETREIRVKSIIIMLIDE